MPTVMNSEKHISATQLGMFQRCGEQYRRRYIEGEILPPNARMVRGTGIHKARQANLTQKIESKQDLLKSEVLEAARDAVVSEFQNEIALDDGQSAGQAKGETIDAAIRLAECDYLNFQIRMQPLDVERKIIVSVPGLGRDIMGILDTSDESGAVRDLKAMSKTPPQSAAETSDQLSTYALLYRTAYEKLPSIVQLDAVVDLKAGPKAVAVASTRSTEDLDMILRRYYAAITAIDKGVFIPAPSDHWCCNPKWCGYYDTCPYARQGAERPEN